MENEISECIPALKPRSIRSIFFQYLVCCQNMQAATMKNRRHEMAASAKEAACQSHNHIISLAVALCCSRLLSSIDCFAFNWKKINRTMKNRYQKKLFICSPSRYSRFRILHVTHMSIIINLFLPLPNQVPPHVSVRLPESSNRFLNLATFHKRCPYEIDTVSIQWFALHKSYTEHTNRLLDPTTCAQGKQQQFDRATNNK